MEKFVTIFGKSYPVMGSVFIRSLGGDIPLVDIKMMSDERERELAQLSVKGGVALWTN